MRRSLPAVGKLIRTSVSFGQRFFDAGRHGRVGGLAQEQLKFVPSVLVVAPVAQDLGGDQVSHGKLFVVRQGMHFLRVGQCLLGFAVLHLRVGERQKKLGVSRLTADRPKQVWFGLLVILIVVVKVAKI